GRWVQFDPTRMSPLEDLVRIATGRDAKDCAFATFYGPARMLRMEPRIERVCPQQSDAHVDVRGLDGITPVRAATASGA
ncbi:MAG: hypothetical protein ABW220_09410, partial [Burkholderiaceae bacterium]